MFYFHFWGKLSVFGILYCLGLRVDLTVREVVAIYGLVPQPKR